MCWSALLDAHEQVLYEHQKQQRSEGTNQPHGKRMKMVGHFAVAESVMI